MKSVFFSILAVAALSLSSCSKTKDPVEPGQAQPGFVTGKVVDAQGKPIAKADIVANNTQFYNSNVLGQTDANGNYKLELGKGSWYIRGSVKIKYDNLNYILDLFTEDDGAFAGTDGAVKNLHLKVSGDRTGNYGDDGFYGGQIEVISALLQFIDVEDVEVSLEPVAALIDGSTGQKLLRHAEGLYIDDVPLGKYKITARTISGNKPLRVRMLDKGQFQSALTANFEPAYAGATGRYKLNLEVSE